MTKITTFIEACMGWKPLSARPEPPAYQCQFRYLPTSGSPVPLQLVGP